MTQSFKSSTPLCKGKDCIYSFSVKSKLVLCSVSDTFWSVTNHLKIYWIKTTTILFYHDSMNAVWAELSWDCFLCSSWCSWLAHVFVVSDLNHVWLLAEAGVLSQPRVVHRPSSWPPRARSPDDASGFLRTAREGKPQYTSTLQVSACLMFIILFAKASHVAKPRVCMEGNCPRVWTQKAELLWPLLEIIYHRQSRSLTWVLCKFILILLVRFSFLSCLFCHFELEYL